MKTILAKHAGFCFGVKRAVDMVYEQIKKRAPGQKIYTYGPIIHNEEVVKDLEEKGVVILHSEEELLSLPETPKGGKAQGGFAAETAAKETSSDIIIIRSHGVKRSIYDSIEGKGYICVDATCPFVKRIHEIAERESRAGAQVVIIGDRTHPEVEGIIGWCCGDVPPVVIGTEEEARRFAGVSDTQNDTPDVVSNDIRNDTNPPPGRNVSIMSQTTFNRKKFQNLVEIIQENRYNHANVVKTICNATEERQTEAKEIADAADAVIVIGGAQSSNTRKLFEICKKECENTYLVQTLKDLPTKFPESVGVIGITAGASTPKTIIEEVQSYVGTDF